MWIRLLFGVCLTVSILMLIQSIQIAVYYFSALNDFGLGFLAGKIILFLIFGLLAFFFGKKAFSTKRS